MEIITITNEAKSAISTLCNKSVVVEYDMLLNYPRIIDHIINYEKIKDELLIKDLDKLGSDSLRHFNKMFNLVSQLGYEPVWQTSVLPRVIDVLEILERQLGKEKLVRDIYRDAKRIAMNSKTKVKGREFFGKFLRVKDAIPEDVITADEIISTFDRLILDEERHARIVEDSIATLNALMKR